MLYKHSYHERYDLSYLRELVLKGTFSSNIRTGMVRIENFCTFLWLRAKKKDWEVFSSTQIDKIDEAIDAVNVVFAKNGFQPLPNDYFKSSKYLF